MCPQNEGARGGRHQQDEASAAGWATPCTAPRRPGDTAGKALGTKSSASLPPATPGPLLANPAGSHEQGQGHGPPGQVRRPGHPAGEGWLCGTPEGLTHHRPGAREGGPCPQKGVGLSDLSCLTVGRTQGEPGAAPVGTGSGDTAPGATRGRGLSAQLRSGLLSDCHPHGRESGNPGGLPGDSDRPALSWSGSRCSEDRPGQE